MGKGRDGSGVSEGTESLEDLVYRPELFLGHARVRKANPFITVPVTLLGYGLLGFLGWMLVKQSEVLTTREPKQVIVDLEDFGEGETPQATAIPPPAGGSPPPGALVREDAPPPPISATSDAIPDKPPEALPTQDQSNVAFPMMPVGGVEGTGEASGPGAGGTGEGTGTSPTPGGYAVKTIKRDFESLRIKYTPPKPPYPAFARSAGIQGTVRVEVIVGTDGVPISAKAFEGPPMLRSTAEAQALKYRYEPAMENGEPVIASTVFKMTFTINAP
jgi:protein TonB